MRDFTTRLAKPPEAQPSRGACDFSPSRSCSAPRKASAGCAMSLQPPAERAARSWGTPTLQRNPIQAAEHAWYRHGASQGPQHPAHPAEVSYFITSTIPPTTSRPPSQHCAAKRSTRDFQPPYCEAARSAAEPRSVRILYNCLRSAQRGVGRRDAKKRIRDKLRSVRSHGPAPAKATHSPIIHFQFPIPTPISVLFSSVLLFLRRMKSTGAHKPFYSIESRTHLK